MSLLLSALLFAGAARAEAYVVLGRTVNLPLPDGYCVLGATPEEREFVERFRALTASTGQLLQVAVPCSDVERAAQGAISAFPRMLTVRVIPARGQLRIDNRTRSEFLASLGAQRVDLDAANKRMQAELHNSGISSSAQSVASLGRDDLAVYWSMTGLVKGEGRQVKTASVSGAILVNGLPLSVTNTVHTEAEGGESMVGAVQRYVQLVVARNE